MSGNLTFLKTYLDYTITYLDNKFVNKTDASQHNFQSIQYTNIVLKFLVQIISFKISDNS
jgi:hypothetical protein